MPKDDVGTGWKKRAVLPSWRSVPVQPAASALALAMSVLLLVAVVYLGSTIDGLRERQAGLESRLVTLESQPSGDPAAQEEALEALAARVDASAARIAAVETVPRADPEALAALDSRVTVLSDRTDALEARPPGDPVALQGLAAELDASTARVAALEAAPRAEPEALAALGTQVTALSSRADALEAVPRADPEALAALGAQVTALSVRTDALEARPPGDPAALQGLAAGLDASTARVAALEAAPRADPEALVALGTQVTALSSRADALETRPAGDPAALDMLTAGLDTAVARISALEALPRTDPGAIETLGNQLTGLSGRLSEIETSRVPENVVAEISPTEPAVRRPGVPSEGSWSVLGEIRFGSGSFGLAPSAAAGISAIAAAAIETGRQIVIRGYADRVGNPVFNQALSLRRAIAVQLALIDHDVPTWQFHSVDGYGEDALPIRTVDEKPEPGNRVVIVFGGTRPAEQPGSPAIR